MVIFITNHSNDDNGDMYVGPNAAAPVEYVSETLAIECATRTEKYAVHEGSVFVEVRGLSTPVEVDSLHAVLWCISPPGGQLQRSGGRDAPVSVRLAYCITVSF